MVDLTPDPTAFAAAYAAGRAQIVWTKLVADLETPVSAYLKLADGRRNTLLFESVEGGAIRGRYSFIGLKPDLIFRTRGREIEINRNALIDPRGGDRQSGDPIAALRALIAESRIDLPAGLPPMAAGLFGYLSYDMVRHMERLPDANPDPLNLPESVLIRPTVVAIFDTIEDTITLVTPVRPDPGIDAAAAYRLAQERLAEVVHDLDRALPYRRDRAGDLEPLGDPQPATSREAYMAGVEKAKEYIRAGDIFQVVPSVRFTLPFRLPAFSFYRALRRLNPSPFLVHLALDDMAICASSPEILVRARDRQVTIRPLAGTRPRGADAVADKALEEDLLADPKERAEHLMLLDLGRNDVGRVAEIGTVTVTDQFQVERYSHVMHIVSNVTGRLREDADLLDALAAGFPAGTVSGAPKVRAMEIIDELEPVRRGVYAGAMGYIGAGGDMDTCIALRTAVITDDTLVLQAGAGVVADSDPASEWQECVNKAKALVRAAEEAMAIARRR